MVAVDSRTGGVSGESITIPARTGASLSDLNGNWAEADVEALLAQHLVAGYPDNTFRPDAPITRAELVVLLAGALGWSGSTPASRCAFPMPELSPSGRCRRLSMLRSKV